MPRPPLRTALWTAAAVAAFAANSLLCRAALGSGAIGPVAFSALRIAAGALVLAGLVALRGRRGARRAGGGILPATMLSAYVFGFSLAYVELGTGTGALLLFGAVQLTMVGQALRRGERPGPREWLGIMVAITGLVVLVAPGLSAPPLRAASLMVGAGVAWGAYTLIGRGSRDPLAETATNFGLALFPAAVGGLSLVAGLDEPVRTPGVIAALASGGLTSGIGYALWFAVLPELSRTRAALLQLAVPVLAAAAGIALLGEPITARLAAAALLVPGGIALGLTARGRAPGTRA
jgi:drug/metabolite transporter (DMT)-like permease